MDFVLPLLASISTATITSTASTSAVENTVREELEELGVDLLGVHIHAFVSQGFMWSTGNNYLAESKRGSPELSEVGINFTRSLTDELRLGVQLFARDLGPIGNYSAKLDWYYLDYRFADWLGIRAGRVKIPFGLYNDSSDTDAARVPVLLPQSTYPTENRDFLLSQTGGEIYGYVALGGGDAGGIDYRLFGGTIFLDATTAFQTSPDTRVLSIDTPYLFGARILYDAPFGLRAGGSVEALRLDLDYVVTGPTLEALKMMGTVPADSTGRFAIELPAVLWMASLEYSSRAFAFTAEYGRWHTKVRSPPGAPTVLRETETVSERFYGMISRELTDDVQLSAYYSVLFPNIDKRETRAGSQQDVALTLRWDINSFWLIKLEGHYLRGTAALSAALNDNMMPATLELDWVLLLAKTTLYF